MLTAIVDMLARAFGQRLEARLAQETAERLTAFGARLELALASGDVTAEGLGGAEVARAVGDKKRKVS